MDDVWLYLGQLRRHAQSWLHCAAGTLTGNEGNYLSIPISADV
jgi:hypothetical protein